MDQSYLRNKNVSLVEIGFKLFIVIEDTFLKVVSAISTCTEMFTNDSLFGDSV